jgi:predicted 3-demethylubiquinone-9 3-methyltransferase (glyoxalase superfamily)
MQKITPFLWFNGNLEEAIDFYCSAFENTGTVWSNRIGNGKISTAMFRLAGKEFMALDGGPMFQFSQATSFFVTCGSEDEVSGLWEKLGGGGAVLMPLSKYPFSEKYGWIQDKFGISWQLHLANTKQDIAPALMFVNEQNGKAGEAIDFYISLFQNSKVLYKAYYEEGEGGSPGTLKHASFSLDGIGFIAMDSNVPDHVTFTPAISHFVNCSTQDEVDHFWEKLSEGGKKDRCGWLKDKYGVSWQIIPEALGRLMYDQDRAKSQRVLDAMMKMDKIIIKDLEQAYNG